MREQAEANVLAARGSRDVPGFDLCVEAEISRLVDEAVRAPTIPRPDKIIFDSNPT